MQAKRVESIGIDYIYDYYKGFLERYPENTMKNYKVDIKSFCKYTFDKDPDYVTFYELKSLKGVHITKYYNWMKEIVDGKQRYSNSTIRRRLKSLKGFMEYISIDHKDIDVSIFKAVKEPKVDKGGNGSDPLSWAEAEKIWKYAEENIFSSGTEVAMLFKLASITSIRLSALLSSTWEDNWFTKTESGVVINYIQAEDKGKVNKKPVSEDFFKELQQKLGTTGKLFPRMYPNKVGNILKKCLKDLSFDERRNITFHSFKKTGVMRSLDKTAGNIYKAKEQGNHSSIATTEGYYLKYKESLADMTSYSLDKEVDVKEEISKYSKEELLTAIEKMSDSSKFELCRILEEL